LASKKTSARVPAAAKKTKKGTTSKASAPVET
jgi:hypothetical protein